MEKRGVIKKLSINVSKLTNEKRRLQRKSKRLEGLVEAMRVEEASDEDADDEDVDDEDVDYEDLSDEDATDEDATGGTASSSLSSSILDVVSPHSRKKVYQRLSQQSNFPAIRKQLRKEGKRINLRDSLEEQGNESLVRKELTHVIENFMNEEGNSSECPDKDKTHMIYRLDFLSVLHQKFLAESGRDCSFAQFCRLIPENIVKPKPTDWGTNLCMICINPN